MRRERDVVERKQYGVVARLAFEYVEADSVVTAVDEHVGEHELNYLVSRLARAYVAAKGLRYEHLNTVVGALESAKAEAAQVPSPSASRLPHRLRAGRSVLRA